MNTTPLQPTATLPVAEELIIIGIIFAIVFFYIFCQAKIFKKAGQPGWAAIIPIYNYVILLKVVGRPLWWTLLLFFPFVNLVVIAIMALNLGKVFGKSSVFSFFLLFIFTFIGYPILAFSKAQYLGPAGGSPINPTSPSSPSIPPTTFTPPAPPTTPTAS